MRAKLVAAAVLTASSALLTAPAQADAAYWKGKTRQGRVAAVRTGADGLVTRVVIRWRARCRDGTTLSGGTFFAPPFDRLEARQFEDGGRYRAKVNRRGTTSRNTSFVRGTLARNGPWRGTFHIRSVVRRNGKVVTRCRLGRTRWSARRVS